MPRARVDTLPVADWIAFDRAHPAPTFFARPAWALALARAFPHLQPAALQVTLSGERRVLLPACTHRGFAGTRHVSAFPLGAYTVALRDDGSVATAADATEAVAAIARAYDSVELNCWPFATFNVAAECAHFVEAAVLDLAGGIDAALVHMDGRFRRTAGQAERRGVRCSIETGPQALEAYYALLAESAARWGLAAPSISRALLDAVAEYGGDDVEFWFARRGADCAAGGVMLYGAQEAFFWTAAMRTEFAALRPSNALNLALINRSVERGAIWFNMGASEGLPGVAHFKKQLGTYAVPYRVLRTSTGVYRAARKLRAVLGK